MADRTLKYVLLFCITAFFAVMWGMLLQRNLLLRSGEPPRADFNALLPPEESERSSEWNIYFGGRRIGNSTTEIRRTEVGTIELENSSEIQLRPGLPYVLGFSGRLDLHFKATVSPFEGLQLLRIESEYLGASIVGTVRDEELLLTGRLGEERINSSVPYEPGTFMGDLLSPIIPLEELDEDQVGTTWTVEMVNPLAGSLQTVNVSVAGTRQISVDDERVRVFQLILASPTGRWSSWVTPEAEVVAQGTPFGFVLARADLSRQTLDELLSQSPTAAR
ncbi:MAG: hypothetical protein R6V05_09395 [Candidatus Brocadiia bacterium]